MNCNLAVGACKTETIVVVATVHDILYNFDLCAAFLASSNIFGLCCCIDEYCMAVFVRLK